MMKRLDNPQSGFSLVSVLVGLALLGILAVGFSEYMSNSIGSQRHLEFRGDLENMKRALAQHLSCERTLPPGPCADGTRVKLRKKGGEVIVDSDTANGARVGEWNIRAFCQSEVVKIQYARLDAAGNPVADPMVKNRMLDWADLVPAGLEKCLAEGRVSYASMPVASYNYVSVSNVGSTNQTVTIQFDSTGYSLAAGGFLSDINGWTSPGGAVASAGVTCSTANSCSITGVLTPGRSMRAGARSTCVACAPYQGLLAVTNANTSIGLLGTVRVAESSGQVIASGLAWYDYDISPAYFYDTSAAFTFNGGIPF